LLHDVPPAGSGSLVQRRRQRLKAWPELEVPPVERIRQGGSGKGADLRDSDDAGRDRLGHGSLHALEPASLEEAKSETIAAIYANRLSQASLPPHEVGHRCPRRTRSVHPDVGEDDVRPKGRPLRVEEVGLVGV
jgi:hypothetical protein